MAPVLGRAGRDVGGAISSDVDLCESVMEGFVAL
jgi:hypothetical protein